MKTVNISTQPALSRRSFFRGAGVVLSLPLLDVGQALVLNLSRKTPHH